MVCQSYMSHCIIFASICYILRLLCVITCYFVCIFLPAVLLLRCSFFFFLMIRRPPRSTLDRSSAASDVYKRQRQFSRHWLPRFPLYHYGWHRGLVESCKRNICNCSHLAPLGLSLIHISEPTRPY